MMKKISLLIGVLFLIGCGEKTHTVDEYLKNETLYNEFMAKCKNGELHEQHINCVNVIKARSQKIKQEMLDAMTGDKF